MNRPEPAATDGTRCPDRLEPCPVFAPEGTVLIPGVIILLAQSGSTPSGHKNGGVVVPLPVNLYSGLHRSASR